jgi:hypothetical protein
MLQHGSSSPPSSGELGINDLSESAGGMIKGRGLKREKGRKLYCKVWPLRLALAKAQTKTSADMLSFLLLYSISTDLYTYRR